MTIIGVIGLILYALSVLIGLAYPTFMEGISEGKGEPFFIKTSEVEETQSLFFFWPAYIVLGLVLLPILGIGWLLHQSILFLGRQWGKR